MGWGSASYVAARDVAQMGAEIRDSRLRSQPHSRPHSRPHLQSRRERVPRCSAGGFRVNDAAVVLLAVSACRCSEPDRAALFDPVAFAFAHRHANDRHVGAEPRERVIAKRQIDIAGHRDDRRVRGDIVHRGLSGFELPSLERSAGSGAIEQRQCGHDGASATETERLQLMTLVARETATVASGLHRCRPARRCAVPVRKHATCICRIGSSMRTIAP